MTDTTVPTMLLDEDRQVLTLKMIEELHDLSSKTAGALFSKLRPDMNEGSDYFSLERADFHRLSIKAGPINFSDPYEKREAAEAFVWERYIPRNATKLTLITRSGYAFFLNTFTDPLSKKIRHALLQAHLAETRPRKPTDLSQIERYVFDLNLIPYRIGFFADDPDIPWVALDDAPFAWARGTKPDAIQRRVDQLKGYTDDIYRLTDTTYIRASDLVLYAESWLTSSQAEDSAQIRDTCQRALNTYTTLAKLTRRTNNLRLTHDKPAAPSVFDEQPSGWFEFNTIVMMWIVRADIPDSLVYNELIKLPEVLCSDPEVMQEYGYTEPYRIWRGSEVKEIIARLKAEEEARWNDF